MKNKTNFILIILIGACLRMTSLQAQTPNLLNYQGKLIISGLAVSGSFGMTFSIYSSETGGTALWTETQTVIVTKGVFNVMLGSVTPFPNTLFSSAGDRFLGIKVGADPEIAPRFRLTSAAFAIRAREAEGVADAAINTADLADGIVTAPKIAAGQVVKSVNGRTDAVTLVAGPNVTLTPSGNTITIASTAAGVPSINNITGPVTIAGAGGATITTRRDSLIVTASGGGGSGIQGVQNTNNTLDITNPNGPTATINIKNNAITGLQLADNAVNSAKVLDGAIATIDLAPSAVDSSKLAISSVTSARIATGAVISSKIATGAVTSAQIADGTIQPSDLAFTAGTGTITGVTAGNGLTGGGPSGSVMLSVATNGITSTMIQDGTITTADIATTAAIPESKLALNNPTHPTINDPTTGEKAALAGTNGTPSNTNRFVTNNDSRNSDPRPPNGTAGGDLTGSYPSPIIANNAVTSAKIADGTIQQADLAFTLGTGDITDVNAGVGLTGGGTSGSVTLSVVTNGITSTMIQDGTITTADIATTAAIAENKLALNFPTHSNTNDPTTGEKAALAGTNGTPSNTNRFVTNNDSRNSDPRPPNGTAGGDLTGSYPSPIIANNAVTSAKIADGTIQQADLAFTLGTGDITDVNAGAGLTGGGTSGSVTLSVATNGITSTMIQNNTITASDISFPFSGSTSSSNTAFAIINNGGGTGVLGQTNGGGDAILGYSTGDNHAGYFEVANSGNGSEALHVVTDGGGFTAFFEGTGGSSKGVEISAAPGQVGLVVANGTKNAVVATSQGARLLYTEESSEVWFTDYGFGRLQNGQAVITFDPIFAETVNLQESYHVFVQAYGNAELYVSQRTPTAFTVRLREGDPNVEFSYRLVAKRRGYERDRLKRAPWAEDDPNLYPEKRAAWEAKHKPNSREKAGQNRDQ